MKKIALVMTICMMAAGFTACGGEEMNLSTLEGQFIENESGVQETDGAASEPAKGGAEAENQPQAGNESGVQETDGAASEPSKGGAAESQSQAGEAGEAATESAAEMTGEVYEDNFAVDNEAAAAFAQQIKDAVAAQDLEALADLTSFPVYVGFKDGGNSVKTRDDFVALGAEKIFTPELVEAMANADKTEFPPSMAGFTVSDGRPGITFAVVDGSLGIVGINY